MKKFLNLKTLCFVLVALIVLYIIACIVCSCLLNTAIKEIYNSKSYEDYDYILKVDKETYDMLDEKSGYTELKEEYEYTVEKF